MKTLPLAAAAWLMGIALAGAQEPARAPITQGDVHFVIGWQNLHKQQPQERSYSNDWVNSIFYGGAGAGWYWTDNLKTQVDFGGGTRGDQHRYEYTTVNGVSTSSSSRLTVQQQGVAIAQQYQFFRNQWVHPHLGGRAADCADTVGASPGQERARRLRPAAARRKPGPRRAHRRHVAEGDAHE